MDSNKKIKIFSGILLLIVAISTVFYFQIKESTDTPPQINFFTTTQGKLTSFDKYLYKPGKDFKESKDDFKLPKGHDYYYVENDTYLSEIIDESISAESEGVIFAEYKAEDKSWYVYPLAPTMPKNSQYGAVTIKNPDSYKIKKGRGFIIFSKKDSNAHGFNKPTEKSDVKASLPQNAKGWYLIAASDDQFNKAFSSDSDRIKTAYKYSNANYKKITSSADSLKDGYAVWVLLEEPVDSNNDNSASSSASQSGGDSSNASNDTNDDDSSNDEGGSTNESNDKTTDNPKNEETRTYQEPKNDRDGSSQSTETKEESQFTQETEDTRTDQEPNNDRDGSESSENVVNKTTDSEKILEATDENQSERLSVPEPVLKIISVTVEQKDDRTEVVKVEWELENGKSELIESTNLSYICIAEENSPYQCKNKSVNTDDIVKTKSGTYIKTFSPEFSFDAKKYTINLKIQYQGQTFSTTYTN